MISINLTDPVIKFSATPLMALGSSGETTVVDSLVTVNGTQDIDATFSIPVVKMDSPLGAQRIEMQTQSIKLATMFTTFCEFLQMINAFTALLEARDPALGRFRAYLLEAGHRSLRGLVRRCDVWTHRNAASASATWCRTKTRGGNSCARICDAEQRPSAVSALHTSSASSSILRSGVPSQ
jgi:hypothetical protein